MTRCARNWSTITGSIHLPRQRPIPLRPRRRGRGAQFVSIKYTERLLEAEIEHSVDSRDDSYENALAETMSGRYKTEVIHRRGRWCSSEFMDFATLEWAEWFDNRHLLAPITYIPPARAKERYDASLDQPAMAA
jgi:transposase InsO family protein